MAQCQDNVSVGFTAEHAFMQGFVKHVVVAIKEEFSDVLDQNGRILLQNWLLCPVLAKSLGDSL